MRDSNFLKPNFLFLFPDQWRWDWLGCERSPYGKVPVFTPNIDRLADEGVRFSGCRSNSPVCAPARACLTQGLRYHRCQVPDNTWNTPTNTPNFFRLLREAGYHTATCGKSDLFKRFEGDIPTGYIPRMEALGFSDGIDHRGKGDAVAFSRRGVEEPYTMMLKEAGLLETHWSDHPETPLDRRAYPTPLPREYYTDDFCGQNGLKLLERAPNDQPWLLWLNFPGPHDPYDPPAEWMEQYEGVAFPEPVCPAENPPSHRNSERDRPHYAACCSNIDDWVGRLVAEIERRGERERTVIVFASDHGEMLGDHGRWAKQIWHEGSLRVPLIVSGPGVAAGAHTDVPVELIDIAASVLDLANVEAPTGWDSRSFKDALSRPDAPHRDYAISQLKGWRCVTSNRWKYVETQDGERLLFDLGEDPAETANLAVKLPEETAHWAAILAEESPWMSLE